MGLCVTAAVMMHTYNNTKGVGVFALLNFSSTEGGEGLAVILYDQGNSDALQLATIDPATGKIEAGFDWPRREHRRERLVPGLPVRASR